MTPEIVKALIARITYKPGWSLSLRTGALNFDRWMLPWTCCESEVLHTALLAAITAEEHECREHFMLDGKRRWPLSEKQAECFDRLIDKHLRGDA